MKRKEKNERTDQKRHKSLSHTIYLKILRITKGRIPGCENTKEKLVLLSSGADIKEKLDEYYEKKVLLALKTLGCGIALTFLMFLSERTGSVLSDGFYLLREEDAYEQQLTLVTEDNEKTTLDVVVEPRVLTYEESMTLLEDCAANMESYILGENTSVDEIRYDLNLVDEIEGTPVTVEWEMDTYKVLNLDGSLREENITEDGTIVNLTATLSCGPYQMQYQTTVVVFPPVMTAEEEWLEAVESAIDEAQEASSEEDLKALPKSVEGIRISWEENKSSNVLLISVLTLICTVAVFFAGDSDLKKEVEHRNRQLELDYARIVSKLVLLISAGATVHTAWETTAKDYLAKRAAGKEDVRYAFEEMVLACREMDNGVAEAKAYENFGLRCRLPCYMKLSALLEQNIRKGSKGLSRLLNAEISEAFEQRKAAAVRQGEEASTKLLLPMMLLLVVVMIIIIVPAGMSMQI